MKKILLLIAVLMAAVVIGVSAQDFSLEFGATGYDFNALSSQQAAKAPLPITDGYNLSPDPYFNGSYLLKMDGFNLKFGVMGEDMMGTIYPSFVQIGRVEPYAEISGSGFTFRSSLPMYFLGFDKTNDPGNTEMKYMFDKYYKGVYLSTDFSTNAPNFLFTNFDSLAYRINFDKSSAMILSTSTEFEMSPEPWMYDVKPQLSFIYGPLQLDVKESIYFADGNSTGAVYATRFYTDPKLTFDLGCIGVKGLKTYLAASIFTADSSGFGTFWYGDGYVASNGKNQSATNALGSSITPGISYTIAGFYVEAAFKISNYDDSLGNLAGKSPTFDPSVKVSYTLSF
jgi:hypothetical protein